jgi:hypothetical protein
MSESKCVSNNYLQCLNPLYSLCLKLSVTRLYEGIDTVAVNMYLEVMLMEDLSTKHKDGEGEGGVIVEGDNNN